MYLKQFANFFLPFIPQIELQHSQLCRHKYQATTMAITITITATKTT